METACVSLWGGSVLFIALGTWGDVLPLFSVALHLFDAGVRAALPASHGERGSRKGKRRCPESADRPGARELVTPADAAREDAEENGGSREGAVNAEKTRGDVRTLEESERHREVDKPQSREQKGKKEHGEEGDKRAGRSSQGRRLLAGTEGSCARESTESEKKTQKAKGGEEEEGHAQKEITEEEMKRKRREEEQRAWERRRNTEGEEAHHLRRTGERQRDSEQGNATVILEIIFATHQCWIKPLIEAFSPTSPVYSSPFPSSSSFPASSFRASSSCCSASSPLCAFECISAEEAYQRRLAGGEDLVRLLSALASSRQSPPLTLSSSVLSAASRVRFSFVSLPSPPLRASAAALFHPGELEPLLTVLCGSVLAARSLPTSAESASPPCAATVSDRGTPPSRSSPQLSPLQSSSPRPASLSSAYSPATSAPFALCVCSPFGAVWLHAAEKARLRCLLLVPSPRLALRAPPPGILEALQEEAADLGEERQKRRRGETPSLLQWAVDRVGGARPSPISLEDLRLWQWRLCLADHGEFRETFLSLPASLFDPPNDCHPAASPSPCPLPASPMESTSSRSSSLPSSSSSSPPSSSSSSSSSSCSSSSSSCSSSSSFVPFRPLSVPVVFLLDAWLFPEVAKSLPGSACMVGAADAPWRNAMDLRSLCRDLRRQAPSRTQRPRRDRRLALFSCLSLSPGSTALAFYGDEGALLASPPGQRERGRTERFRERERDREARKERREGSPAGGRTAETWPGDKVERSPACARRRALRFGHPEAASRCRESAPSSGADASTARGETTGEEAKRFRRRETGAGRCVSERDTKKTKENAHSEVENVAEIERGNARQHPHSDETDALGSVAKLPQGGSRGGCSPALKEVETVEKKPLIYVSFGSLHASEMNLLPSPQTLIRVLARVGVALDARY
uniref:Putative transmembrane protein n=1 Tax=Toxoplasma gondii COUG TaxID=1074873 RepID=A0A2G8Y583_TOXGO|nr:putative transmembrane protein [Toxoplasma gondii COUG]